MTTNRLFTIGHSRRTFGEFAALLRIHGVARLADVRRFPTSRRHPQFNGGQLESVLRESGIEYRHFGDLGGYRGEERGSEHSALREPAFRAYAAYMNTRFYAETVRELEAWSAEATTALMCAEADPVHCHRNLLADALLRDGFRVVHILGPQATRGHQHPPFLRRDGNRLVYDSGILSLDFDASP